MKAVVLWLLIAIQIAGAQKDYPATFRNWVGKADAEISAVEPSKGCKTNGECGQNQFCDFVFANGIKEQRQRCFNVPAIVGEVKIGAAIGIGLKLCSSLKDCDKPDACYPLAQEVHDPATNNLFKGVCSKIVVTEDPGEILGEPCEKPNACTEDQFREYRMNYGVRGCKKFDANVFISQGRGVCLQAQVYCPSKLRAGQPYYNEYEICIKESEITENSDVGTICCPIPFSDTVYWGDVGRSNKIPRGYEENNGTGRLCEKSESCKADEFCDDSLNFLNGVEAKDTSGPNRDPLRFCYSVPFKHFFTYENNEKKFCSSHDDCGRGAMCEEIALHDDSPKPFLGFCVEDKRLPPAFEPTTEEEPTSSEENDLEDLIDEDDLTATACFSNFSKVVCRFAKLSLIKRRRRVEHLVFLVIVVDDFRAFPTITASPCRNRTAPSLSRADGHSKNEPVKELSQTFLSLKEIFLVMKAVVLWLLIATQIAGAQKDYPATFQEWVGKADAEISAVEPSKGCTTNGDCGQNQFCDFVFANGKKEQRQRCFNVPAIVGEVKIGAAIGIGLKLCSSLKDCDEPDACYPLAQEVHDPATNNLFKGVCSKIVVTEDPEEILGEPCEKPNACTEAQFRESKTNHGVRGCKKFEASVFLSKDRGVCLRILVLCPSKLRAGQPEDKDYRHCNGEADEVKNSDIGLVCCAPPVSVTLYYSSVDFEEKIPRGYDKMRASSFCDNSQSCKADEFCDNSANYYNGPGVKDDSGPNGTPLRFCYKVPIENFITYENNEKKFCVKNAECVYTAFQKGTRKRADEACLFNRALAFVGAYLRNSF
ncbi:unnamed protein product [Caenorhabditis auriculariae]|uniref:Domain of unknown function DX domain-containing protein n=1 Tax=Caenorhabditis auriculariae TaxID=2777116 RepID=A0A8S1HJ47_9PELO|nr:unnamed protein product [Caenorhabditis auriculariae]